MEIETSRVQVIEEETWKLLQQGAASYKAHFHTAAVATVFEHIPHARTVVLRLVDREKKLLRFHSDYRSAKIRQLNASPLVCWLFYSAELRLQFRMQAIAQLHTDDALAEEAWRNSRMSSRMCYTISSGPGTEIDIPEPVDFAKKEMTEEEAIFARQHFCVVETVVQSIDWLYLHHDGHKRCFIDYVNDKRTWLQV